MRNMTILSLTKANENQLLIFHGGLISLLALLLGSLHHLDLAHQADANEGRFIIYPYFQCYQYCPRDKLKLSYDFFFLSFTGILKVWRHL
jgi:hypothetical protein